MGKLDFEELKKDVISLQKNHPNVFHCTLIPFESELIGGLLIRSKHRAGKGSKKADEFYKWLREFVDEHVLEGLPQAPLGLNNFRDSYPEKEPIKKEPLKQATLF